MRSLPHVLQRLGQCLAIGLTAGIAAGGACAVFARALAFVTAWRGDHPGVIFALPLLGLLSAAALQRWGEQVLRGTRGIFDALQEHGAPLPRRMAPMIFLATVATHLGGGSAGREGAAVQMGASIAETLARPFRPSWQIRRHFLFAGMAGGFGAVFGTPIAAALFSLECVRVGRIPTDSLLPALLAGATGKWAAEALGVEHGGYVQPEALRLQPQLLLQWLAFAAVVALVSSAFVSAAEGIKHHAERLLPLRPLRAAIGGLLIVALWLAFGSQRYLGLGDATIHLAFVDDQLPAATFAAKGLFTAITLGFGFLGGEVTPLFFIGATLGNALSGPLQLPLPLAAACGMAAMFAAAAKTPVSLSVMAAEIFGLPVFLHAFVVSCTACALRARAPGIYGGQRNATHAQIGLR